MQPTETDDHDQRIICTYHCNDGTVRTRCIDHIEATGPYAPIPGGIYHRQRRPRSACIICHHLATTPRASIDAEESAPVR